ncbi:hypothetical protein [Bernardetia sp.]|uniref:GREB1-related protein n=1 Tax=Bernardetia sp. TaxID=1937974 RepID=UPI0025C451B4|nr:hypothetical protein [Bernardetia sp.]
MESLKIVIPSHKRANRVITKYAVSDAIICVEESQAAEYREHNPNSEIVTHPDNVVGISMKRDWIYRHFGDVFMIDDDIKAMRRLYVEKGEKVEVEPEQARTIIENTAIAAKEAGAYLFGFSNAMSPVQYNSFNPISLKGFVNGCGTGLLKGSKLFYIPEIRSNDDYWLSLLNAYHHRICYKDLRFSFEQQDTFMNRGGLSEFRNLTVEQEDFNILQKHFGNAVQLRKGKKHQFQKNIMLPF